MRFNLDKNADRKHADNQRAERRKAAYESSQLQFREMERASFMKGKENQKEAYNYVDNSATKLEARIKRMAEVRMQQRQAR